MLDIRRLREERDEIERRLRTRDPAIDLDELLETDEARLRPVDVPEFRGDASLAASELGWQPGIPLETSLDEVLAEWRAAAAAAPHLAD